MVASPRKMVTMMEPTKVIAALAHEDGHMRHISLERVAGPADPVIHEQERTRIQQEVNVRAHKHLHTSSCTQNTHTNACTRSSTCT